MKPKIVFLIRSNPVDDPRVAEAIRMATGLGTGQNSVKIILSDEAPRLLDTDPVEMEEMDTLERFLPILAEWKVPFYLEKQVLLDRGPQIDPGYQVHPVDPEELAELMAGGHCFFVF